MLNKTKKINKNYKLKNAEDLNKSVNYKYWFGTYNNPGEDWKKVASDLKADYFIGQLEEGENGTKHIQFLVYFVKSQRPSRWKGIPCWVEGISAKAAIERCEAYVQKDETRIDGPFEYGTKPLSLSYKEGLEYNFKLYETGKPEEADLNFALRYENVIDKVLRRRRPVKFLDECCGIWVYGPKGVGKSHPYFMEDPKPFEKDPNQWWDGYDHEETVLLDDLGKSHSNMAHYLKKWPDKWRNKGEIKGGYTKLHYTKFVVTSQYLPHDIFVGDDALLSAIMRRFKFRFYFGYQQYVDGDGLGMLPVLTEEQQQSFDMWSKFNEKQRRLYIEGMNSICN